MGKQLIDGSIFIHIPKTGGSFIEKYLKNQNLIKGSVGGKHDDIFRCLYPQGWKNEACRVVTDFPKVLKNKLNSNNEKHDWTSGPRPEQPTKESLPFMFCFVRNPVSWIESYFRYAKGQNWYYWSSEYDYYGFWHPNAILNDLRTDSFNDFVEKLLIKRPGYITEMYGWYTTPGISSVCKTENLNSDLAKLLESRGLEFDLPTLNEMDKVNESPKSKNDIDWDLTLRDEFVKSEYAAFKRYGYDISDYI
mgnify:CR=1 FL=1